MSVVELRPDDGAALPGSVSEADVEVDPRDRVRPNVSGDLPALFRAAPMFRRAVAGYDRFQVDTYVEWAEDELTTADREREHLLTRHLSTRAALDEARRLLAHSASGGDFLEVSRRIGSMLAGAADEAESMRSEAAADRAAAAAEAQRVVADADLALADAGARAEQLILEASLEVETMTAGADRIVAEAERTSSEVRAEAQARLEKVTLLEQVAAEQAAQIRRQAEADARVARLQARSQAVAMLNTGRNERRRADAAAAATREVLERDAVARCAFLRGEIAALEQRRSALLAEIEATAEPEARTTRRTLEAHLREFRERLHWRSGTLRTR